MRSLLPSLPVLVLLGCGGEEEVLRRELPIVNGVDDPGHPAVGLLQIPKGYCSGTLVGSRTVLTAAHCAEDQGSYRFTIGGKEIKAAKVTAHPEFKGNVAVPGLPTNPWFSVADVAVILLEQEVTGIAPVRLVTKEVQKGQALVVVGFGITGPGDTTPPKKRKTENVIGNLGPEFILYGSWGGLEGGPGLACNGDSGGPNLVVEDGEERLLAVTSWGDKPNCNQWAFAARADYYRAWIASQAAGNLAAVGTPPAAIDALSLATVPASPAAEKADDPVASPPEPEGSSLEGGCSLGLSPRADEGWLLALGLVSLLVRRRRR